MSAVTEIHLERETANDEHATVVGVLVESGIFVKAGQLILEVENSKATQEILAPVEGVLLHALRVGDLVSFGEPIASIGPIDRPTTFTRKEKADVALARPLGFTPKLSRDAAELAAVRGLTAADFDIGFVTAKDVRRKLGMVTVPRALQAVVAVAEAALDGGVAVTGSKGEEIKVLSSGAGATMLSVLGVTLGDVAPRRAEDDIFAGKITDLVIYEAARLMKQHPRLNAAYGGGAVVLHERITAGLAIDDGGKLVVYGIENADSLSLADIRQEIVGAVERYMENALTRSEMTRATFTVTDLSGMALDFIFPLLPAGQSAIIAISRTSERGFSLYVGFDHRITEGRDAALFLQALRERVLSFSVADPRCGVCDRPVSELAERLHQRGLMKIVAPGGAEMLCCVNCWDRR